MKIGLEDYLQKIDSSFKDKSQKDIYMTYVMVFGVIFAFSYLLFWETSELGFKAIRKQVVDIESKISIDKKYLQVNTMQKIKVIENETKLAQKQTLVFRDNNDYIKHKIEEISFLIYDEQKWGKYLYSISQKAKENKIKLLNFSNNLAESTNSFGHVLDISIASNAKYKDTINFINSLEQSDLVIDLHTLNIKANKQIDSNLTISVWGLTY